MLHEALIKGWGKEGRQWKVVEIAAVYHGNFVSVFWRDPYVIHKSSVASFDGRLNWNPAKRCFDRASF